MDPRIQNHAHTIVDHSVDVQPGDEVLINAPVEAEDLVVAITELVAERETSNRNGECGDSHRHAINTCSTNYLEMAHCRNCGAKLSEGADVCPDCGTVQPTADEGRNERVVAGVLALFLGWAGVHKFYQGNTKMGVMYALIFWTAAPLIVSVVEGIIMLTTTDEAYEQKYADGSIMGHYSG